jgi:hypothetical protein
VTATVPGPSYSIERHEPVSDKDPDWSIVVFKDRAEGGTGGLTITVSEGTLTRLLSGDLSRPLSTAEVTSLDGT